MQESPKPYAPPPLGHCYQCESSTGNKAIYAAHGKVRCIHCKVIGPGIAFTTAHLFIVNRK